MTKAELESKHLAELHALAAEAGVPRYRMLRREELVEKLTGEKPAAAGRAERPERPERKRPPRRRRERPAREAPSSERAASEAPEAEARPEPRRERAPATEPAAAEPEGTRPRRRRRRRRFGRKGKGVRAHDLLLPPPGRQALIYGESRATCTALLREIAAELSGASNGPDPIALLVDPSPEELAEWKREAPQAEIVAAAQARHAGDALAQASRRAEAGEDVILLVDSLTKLDDADAAKEIFDSALTQANGSLTVVAALERQS
jgi:Rho termination factor, N-terminal domain